MTKCRGMNFEDAECFFFDRNTPEENDVVGVCQKKSTRYLQSFIAISATEARLIAVIVIIGSLILLILTQQLDVDHMVQQ